MNTAYMTQPVPLRQQLAKLLREAPASSIQGNVFAIIVPDSNLVSGGEAAAEIFRCIEGHDFENVIIVSPSHTGQFERLTICSVDHYRTPLGDVPVSDAVRNELCDEDDDIYLDDRGHYHTHGIDVQLPFLQMVLNKFEMVPIVMGAESPDLCKELGHAVGEVMYNRRTLLVACANILEATEASLAQFKNNFEQMDTSRVMIQLNSENVKMQGRGAVLVALIAALHRRANKAKILHLKAPANGHPGYMGAVLWRE